MESGDNLRAKVLTHCILHVRDKHLHDLQHLDVPLQSCRPRTDYVLAALAGAQRGLLHLLLHSQEVEEDMAKKSSLLLVSQCKRG